MDTWVGRLVVASIGVAAIAAGGASAQQPTSLEDCYLKAAVGKTTADTVYLARELCDAVFHPGPRVVAVLHKGECTEWWFDEHGRYETREKYCSLEGAGDRRWTLACQWKAPNTKKVTYVDLREEGNRFVRNGELRGSDVGELFKSLAGCVKHKLGGPAPASTPAPAAGG